MHLGKMGGALHFLEPPDGARELGIAIHIAFVFAAGDFYCPSSCLGFYSRWSLSGARNGWQKSGSPSTLNGKGCGRRFSPLAIATTAASQL